MDIILINTLGIAIGVGLFIGLILVVGYNIWRTKNTKRYNILRIKQYGGVKLSDEDKRFVDKNSHKKYGTMSWGMFDTRRYTLKKVKNRVKMSFLKLNPFFKSNEKISRLEKDVKYHKSDVDFYKSQYHCLIQDVKDLSAELDELKTHHKKVPEPAKKPQEESALIPFANMRQCSKFV